MMRRTRRIVFPFNPLMNYQCGSLFVPTLYAKHKFSLISKEIGTVVGPYNTIRTTAGGNSFHSHDARAGEHRRNTLDVHGMGSHAGEQKGPSFLTTAANSHVNWTKIFHTPVTERPIAATKLFAGEVRVHRM